MKKEFDPDEKIITILVPNITIADTERLPAQKSHVFMLLMYILSKTNKLAYTSFDVESFKYSRSYLHAFHAILSFDTLFKRKRTICIVRKINYYTTKSHMKIKWIQNQDTNQKLWKNYQENIERILCNLSQQYEIAISIFKIKLNSTISKEFSLLWSRQDQHLLGHPGR